MEKYIGFKMIEAEQAALGKEQAGEYTKGASGYRVRYADGYESWSPKEVFENAYLRVAENPALKSVVYISRGMVDEFIREVHVSTLGEKTTCVRAVLVNGFEIVESSACVDPANYDEEMGKAICIGKIKEKVWFLLGFLLQTAIYGVKA